jgi:murein DD-endopeptidase MepM/ murein hydrolase activator NlpD
MMKSLKMLSFLLIAGLLGGLAGCAQKPERTDEYVPIGANTYPIENSYFNYDTAPNGYTTTPSSKKRKSKASSSKTSKSSTRLKSLATTSGIYHTVKKGENLYRIALRYGVSQAAIKSANGLGSSALRVGQKILIPGAKKNSSQDVSPVTKKVAGATATKIIPVSRSSSSTCAPAPKWGWPSQGTVAQTAATVSKGTAIKITGGAQVLKAAAAGTITFVGRGTNRTHRITISHNASFSTVYEYDGKTTAKIGNSVKLGQPIGELNAQTALYFEIRCHKKALNPLTYLPG